MCDLVTLTKESLRVSATEGDLVLGELVSQSLVLLLQRVHGRPRLSRHTTAYIAVKCIIGKLPHQKQHNHQNYGVCVCVCAGGQMVMKLCTPTGPKVLSRPLQMTTTGTV